MENKKSQMATEFLMTYGWAILFAIIVIGILVYYYFSFPPAETDYKCLRENYCKDLNLEITPTNDFYSSVITCQKNITDFSNIKYTFYITNMTAFKEEYSECKNG
jgi:uncharacterized protein YpmS